MSFPLPAQTASAPAFSRSDRIFGAHPCRKGGISGTRFTVWAPNAEAVTVGGSFNEWNFDTFFLKKDWKGRWSCFVPDVAAGAEYQYRITTAAGEQVRKSDPFAYAAQVRPLQASKVCILKHRWKDAGWLRWRKEHASRFYAQPMNIYEVHAGSWRRNADGTFLTYTELGRRLIPYAKKMGYTHIELLPVMEHPLDESWGYQVTGYFAPTSRFGTPEELMSFIDTCHQSGLGVILDWVPAHFPDDAFGLYRFDGTPLYEYSDPRIGRHYRWGTNVFDFGKKTVCDFLISSALFWAQEYHADGLRVDAVASMLYLDYDRPSGEWLPNRDGGNENYDAVAFLRQLNTILHQQCPDVLTIAEESSAWPHVTGPLVDEKALGFDLKWNMGWMNDSLHYQCTDPLYRGACHRDVTFPMMYAFSERYVLPISHDEVVHLKGSLVGKMPGADDARRLANVRAFYLYQLTQPGKKLLMMGSEFSQFSEWDFDRSLDWYLLDYAPFRQQQEFFRAANALYLASPALWKQEEDWSGFRWIEPDDANGNTLLYLRMAEEEETLLFAVNFSGLPHYSYPIGVPTAGSWEVLLSTDEARFGGSTGQLLPAHSVPVERHGYSESVFLDLPPCSAMLLHCTEPRAVRKTPPRRFRR